MAGTADLPDHCVGRQGHDGTVGAACAAVHRKRARAGGARDDARVPWCRASTRSCDC